MATSQSLALVRRRGSHLRRIRNQNRELCMEAVKSCSYALSYVQYQFRTSELYRTAVQHYGEALEYIPEEKRTMELCWIAVKQNGRALKFVPKQFHFSRLLLEAVKQNGMALEFVDEDKQTNEICLEAVRSRKEHSYHSDPIAYVKIQTPDLCMESVRRSPSALRSIKPEFMTNELRLESLKCHEDALDYIDNPVALAVYLVKNQEILPPLMGLNKKLDEIIEEVLK